MTQPKKLTDQQRKFAELYVYNEGRMSPAEAAYAAGYKTRSRQVAAEMRNPKYFPLVVQYIGELRAEVQEKYGITLEKHVTELAKLRDDARTKGAWAAAINAEVARGKKISFSPHQKMFHLTRTKRNFILVKADAPRAVKLYESSQMEELLTMGHAARPLVQDDWNAIQEALIAGL